jgi:hypothetical protein
MPHGVGDLHLLQLIVIENPVNNVSSNRSLYKL